MASVRDRRERPLQPRHRSHRQLRRDQHHRAVAQMGKQRFAPADHRIDVGPVIIVNGSVVTDPEHFGVRDRRGIGCERQPPRLKSVLDEFGKPRLEQRRLAVIEPGNHLRIAIDADGIDPGFRHAGSRNAAEMPETGDRDFHLTRSITQRFRVSQSTVRMMPSRMVSFGFQPSAAMRAVSRKMNLLSPTQPREPPE